MYPPLNSPLHDLVCNNHRYGPVKDLVASASESVEDSGVGGSGKRILSVLGKTVLNNALLRLAAYPEDTLLVLVRWRDSHVCGGHTGRAPSTNVEVQASWVLHAAQNL